MNEAPAQNVLKITGVLLLFLIAVNLLILDIKVFSPPSYTASTQIQITPSPTTRQQSQPTTIPITPTPTTYNSQPISISSPKEYFIPIGSGSTQKNTFDDLKTTDTFIDTTTYGTIKEAFFIAGLKNPTQNGFVEAQLYNVTDKHAVWGSNIKMEGPSSETITSGKISLDGGGKLYRIQLKSSLSASASIENAKIRIVTQ